MTLVVEDGSIISGADSYISTADFTAYAAARSYTLIAGAETLLIQAMDYLESLKYKGVKSTISQPLQWPRINVYIDGYYFPSNEIPQDLIDAQCEVAMAIDAGNGPLADVARQTIREKVGPLDVEYAPGSAPYVINKKIQNKLWKLLAGGGNGSNVINVTKG